MSTAKFELGKESVGEGEPAIIQKILDENRSMMVREGDTTRRAQHPKHHGLAKATFKVRGDIDSKLKVGLFREPANYDALIRFSNGQQQDDRKGDAHGMAIKLLNAPLDRIEPDPRTPGSADFVLIDHPVMFAEDLEQYAAANNFVHDRLAIARGDGGTIRNAVRNAIETGDLILSGGIGLLRRIADFADQEPLSPLNEHYWSQTPFLLGDGQAVKYMAQASDNSDPVGIASGENMLAEALAAGLASGPSRFTFGVHVQRDPIDHPIEDSTVSWWHWRTDPGGVATMVPVADIEITSLADPDEAETIAFSPWNVPEVHRPLGGINRVRREVYRNLAEVRRS